MKDLYELLNEIKIDEEDFVEMPVNEVERARVKKKLKRSIKHKTDRKKAIAVAGLAIACAVALGSTITTYAEEIPIVRDIYKVLNNKVYSTYKETANEVNITKTYKGTTVTINDAVFNGTTITLTYTIKTDKDLGEEIFLENYHVIKEYAESGWTRETKFTKVDDFTYVGQENITLFNFNNSSKEGTNMSIKIHGIRELKDMDNAINGKWNFNLVLKPVEGNKVAVNKQVSDGEVTIGIKSIEVNPMSLFLVYTDSISDEAKWDKIDTQLEVKDDLGNDYQVQYHGGTGDGKTMDWGATIEKLKEGATQLIITPKVTLVDLDEPKSIEVEYKDEITAEINTANTETFEPLEVKEVTMDNIVVEINQ